MNRNPDYEFINNIPVFRELSRETVLSLISPLDKKRFQGGNYFFHQDDKAEFFYILETGMVEIYKSDANGRKLTLWHLESGSVFCLANMFTGRAFASAVAKSECLAFRITRDRLLARIAEDQQLSLQLMQCLCAKMGTYSALLEEFTFRDVKGRLARLLLRFGPSTEGTSVCHLTHGEMASLLGTCREVVTRTLKTFRQAGLIATAANGKKQQISILDAQGLKRFCCQEKD